MRWRTVALPVIIYGCNDARFREQFRWLSVGGRVLCEGGGQITFMKHKVLVCPKSSYTACLTLREIKTKCMKLYGFLLNVIFLQKYVFSDLQPDFPPHSFFSSISYVHDSKTSRCLRINKLLVLNIVTDWNLTPTLKHKTYKN